MGLYNAVGMLYTIVPKSFLGTASQKAWSLFEAVLKGRNDAGTSIKDLESRNQNMWRRKATTDVMQGKNIGDLPD